MLALLLCALMLCAGALAETAETVIVLSDDAITVNGAAISEDTGDSVYLAYVTETHEDVPAELASLQNRVVTIAAAGTYRVSGTAADTQIAVKAGESDAVRLILGGVDISCRTAPAIAVYSALDPRTPGEYGMTIELADGSQNLITGSHTKGEDDDDIEFDGAIGAQISIGFEGTGSLTVDADNEGVEVAFGHLTINGGSFSISACDDPLNVAEDGVGTLTINDGYVYSSVKPLEGGEGDGIDSNGYIVFNGGTVINLAHPTSQDGGIDSDMGSSINGGVIVGAGNMYDPIEDDSAQLFMMLEFGESTDDLVVVTDENDVPVFAYDFPYDYMYIAFSTPALEEGKAYRVYLGGDIEGTQQNGLYTDITAYTPGVRMQHGEGNAQQRMTFAAPDMGEMPGGEQPPEIPQGGMGGQIDDSVVAYQRALESLDLNTLLEGADLNALLAGKDLNSLLTGFSVTDLLTEEQIENIFGSIDLDAVQSMDMGRGMGDMGGDMGRGMGGGMGGPRGMQSSADVATADFVLTRGSTGFTNVTSAQ